jgi:hypothetical protein
MPKPPDGKPVATLVIKGPGKMSKAERDDIVVWLREAAELLAHAGNDLTDGRFRASFTYYS